MADIPLRAVLGFKSTDFDRGLQRTRRNVNGFNRETKGAARTVERDLPNAMKKAGAASDGFFARMRKNVTGLRAGFAALGGVIAFRVAKGFSDAGRDAEETENKFRVVFRGLNDQADDLVENWRQQFGRGRTELRGMLATLQDTFVPMGIARDEAFKLSEAVAGLGIDLASFNNAADEEVINLLTSALVGNHEAVRRYGISITAARLDQELLAQGFQKVSKGATEQQKLMARLSLLFKDTSDAQGDAARTQDSFANVQKRVNARLREAREEVGQQLNAAILELIDNLGGAEKVANNLADAVKAVGRGVKDLTLQHDKGPGIINQLFAGTLGQPPNLGAVSFSATTAGTQGALSSALAGRKESEELEATQFRAAALKKEIAGLVAEYGNLARASGNAATKSVNAFEAEETRLKSLQTELKKTIQDVGKELAQLDQGRAASREGFRDRIFGFSLSSTDSAAQKIELITARVKTLRSEAGRLEGAGNFEEARGKLEKIADLVEQGAALNNFQSPEQAASVLQGLGQEIDGLFQKEIAAQEAAQTAARASLADAEARLQQLGSISMQATGQLDLLNGILSTLDTTKPEELAGIFARLKEDVAGVAATLSQINAASPGGGAGFAQGGVNRDPRDTIPAMLRKGETVLTPQHSKELAPLLQQVGVPGYAQGGSVGKGGMTVNVDFHAAGNTDRDALNVGRKILTAIKRGEMEPFTG